VHPYFARRRSRAHHPHRRKTFWIHSDAGIENGNQDTGASATVQASVLLRVVSFMGPQLRRCTDMIGWRGGVRRDRGHWRLTRTSALFDWTQMAKSCGFLNAVGSPASGGGRGGWRCVAAACGLLAAMTRSERAAREWTDRCMSAPGQTRTSAHVCGTTASPPEADVTGSPSDVAEVPNPKVSAGRNRNLSP